MPLPTDVNDSPNYTPAQHAAHHNEIHTFVNAGGGGGGSGTGFTETSPDVWEFVPAGGTSIDVMTTVAGSAINITAAGAGSDVNVTGVGTVYLSGGGGDATLELSAAEAVLTCSNDAAVVALGGTLTFVDNTGIITLDQIRSGLASGPGGSLGRALATSNQTGITTEVDLTGLSVTVTVGTNRLIRITGYTSPSAVTNSIGPELRIKEGGTQLSAARLETLAVGAGFRTMMCQALVVAPSAGSHTYKLTMVRDSGVGTITNTASATMPSFILVEDLGPP